MVQAFAFLFFALKKIACKLPGFGRGRLNLMVASILVSAMIFIYLALMILAGIRRKASSHPTPTSGRLHLVTNKHKHTPAGQVEQRGGFVQQRCVGCGAWVGLGGTPKNGEATTARLGASYGTAPRAKGVKRSSR